MFLSCAVGNERKYGKRRNQGLAVSNKFVLLVGVGEEHRNRRALFDKHREVSMRHLDLRRKV